MSAHMEIEHNGNISSINILYVFSADTLTQHVTQNVKQNFRTVVYVQNY